MGHPMHWEVADDHPRHEAFVQLHQELRKKFEKQWLLELEALRKSHLEVRKIYEAAATRICPYPCKAPT